MLKLDGVTKIYKVGAFGGKTLTAVDDVSFDLRPGEVVSLIGESGSGKSTIGRMVLGLLRPTGGSITLDGARAAPGKAYYRQVQGVFQDPFSCYNPVFKADRVLRMIKQEYFPEVASTEWDGRMEESLKAVRLNPGQVLGKYPHQLSGGQLQRLLIARALLLDLRFLVADEITSMLDASTRIDVLNLLADLKARGLGVLFVTHDLSLGNYISEQAVVLYRGRVVEAGTTDRVFGNPLHPYTARLLASVPQLTTRWDGVPVVAADGPQEPSALVEAEPGHFVRRSPVSPREGAV
ncbi:ATP-binding cassette domain-containing protein [Streptosporangium sp. NBC_01639]|uniref:ATP-binding cassette domain-containing protein n=1 Tax=Streptosporangium sp. NBC_01639 TaxID=2975948 RepID=UPI003863A4CE|nr:ATP-binding cassette domain-containing protein [Streptosporangium sp. NBC_01639]